MRELRQSTSVDLPIGPFLDETDGKTAETALTITQPDIRLKKGGGAWAQKNAAQTLSHEENGYYEVTLDATDTGTLGMLRLAVAESGALPVWEDFMVMTAAAWDAKYASGQHSVIADSLSTAAKAEVRAEVTGALRTDASTELTAVPAITASIYDQIRWVFTFSRNKVTQTNSQTVLRNDADSSTIATATVSDDGTTATKGKMT